MSGDYAFRGFDQPRPISVGLPEDVAVAMLHLASMDRQRVPRGDAAESPRPTINPISRSIARTRRG